MSATTVRILSAAIGTGTALAGGLVAGDWWWVVAGVGAGAGLGALFDRHLAFVQVLASLALVAGIVGAGHDWFVAVLAAGTISSIELAAAADRTSVVRQRVPDVARIARIAPSAAVLALAVLVVGSVSQDLPAVAAVVAAVAATMAIRVIAR